jgi:hypothetical protein
LVDWCAWVRTEAKAMASDLLEPMRKAADLVGRHLEGILGHWKKGLTTALLEGLNSLFSATKRKRYGGCILCRQAGVRVKWWNEE